MSMITACRSAFLLPAERAWMISLLIVLCLTVFPLRQSMSLKVPFNSLHVELQANSVYEKFPLATELLMCTKFIILSMAHHLCLSTRLL